MEKKLQRDTQHKVISGVCSGLANYFDIDASLVRLLFAIAFFAFSSGLCGERTHSKQGEPRRRPGTDRYWSPWSVE